MNELKVFNFQDNEVRTVHRNSEAWFNLNDVCRILDIKNPRDTKSRLKHDGVGSIDVIDNLGRVQSATFINVWTPSTATRMKVQQLTMDIEED